MPLAEPPTIALTRSKAQPWTRFARRGTRFARGVLVAGIAAFSALAAVVPTKQGEALDRAITAKVQANDDPRIERAAVAVSWFGFRPQSRLLPLAYAAVLWIARFRLEAIFQLAASGTGLLATIVKSLMRRPRPVAGKDLRVVAAPLRGSSLPSGHVLTYVGVYGWMAIMANRLIGPPLLRRLAVGALASLIAAVGASRIYLGHHWPSDVFASYLLGSSYLAALLVAYRRLQSRRVHQ
ncbi:MAG TPA: phosphatase PAP2 family protein [Candidatus Limnocylindrales bacterium]|nr:phosphatase PAP2 family protein [Candidatus Limnocylindrales bacterium]